MDDDGGKYQIKFTLSEDEYRLFEEHRTKFGIKNLQQTIIKAAKREIPVFPNLSSRSDNIVAKTEQKESPNNIDEATSERKTWLDSEMFTYRGDTYSYNSIHGRIYKEFLPAYKRFESNKYHYMDEINGLMASGKTTLVVDYNDICQSEVFMKDISDFIHSLLEQNPKLFLRAFRRAAHDILKDINPEYAQEIIYEFRVVLSNAVNFKKEITQINHIDVGHIMYTENFVISTSEQKDYTKNMAWMCDDCGKLTYKPSIGFRLARLQKCMWCDSRSITESNKDAITDTMQEIKIQQRFERIEAGMVPKTIMCYVYGKDMINMVSAGDMCSITAVVDTQRNAAISENAVSEYVLEILWIEKIPDDFLIEDDPELEERVATFIDPNNEDAGYQTLIESIAPSVMGHEIIKEALLLQLVGSDTAWFSDNSRHRGESNILLVGDAGTAKTKLGYYVYQLYGRAVYVAGKVTEAGMTASVSTAVKGGHQVLTAGAYLLASSDAGGIVIADEMEKTEIKAKDSTAACLDDRQMVEIHKGNIHQSIQINCASLHIANPKTGEAWSTDLSIKENTGFENWYLSRFCTWVVRDEVDKERDTAKAQHYLKQFGTTIRQHELKDTSLNEVRRKQALEYRTNKRVKSVPEMRMLYKYVRRTFHPKIDPKSKVAKRLVDFYISMRPMTGNTKGFRVTMRNLGDLVRFTEESARAHFRNHCTDKDADIAIKLVSSSIASSGFNMFTQEYDDKLKEQQLMMMQSKGVEVGSGFFSAKDLLENKTAREIITQDLAKLSLKRQNRFFKEVQQKMKKVIYVVRKYSLLKCRDCGGDGFRREGGMVNACYSCQSHGGFIQPFHINELDYQLRNVGLTPTDIQELTSHLIKKKIIVPRFNDSNQYTLTKDYKNALLELQAIETQIELVMDTDDANKEQKKKEFLIRNPEMQEKIHKLRNFMSPEAREEIKRKLNQVDISEEEENDAED